MPKLHPFEHKGNFPNLETFRIMDKNWGENVISVNLTSIKWESDIKSSTMYEISLKNEKI